jgi:hypothetical protein
VPVAGRAVFAVLGAGLVLVAGRSLLVTVVVPRRARSWLPRMVDRVVDIAFHAAVHGVRDVGRRERRLAGQAPLALLLQLAAWLVSFLVGFALLLWPWQPGSAAGLGAAFTESGSAMFTLGYATPRGAGPVALVDVAALVGLVTVALQIGYLPALYAAFNRRETEVTLLFSRAGLPAWGPELLLRTHYGFLTGTSALPAVPDLYRTWERWAADVAESHATYPTLMRFRSPTPLGSWVTALLAVLDSAALYLALAPDEAPALEARLCLRMGFTCFREVAATLGHPVPPEADPAAGITLRYDEFAAAVELLGTVNFPVRRSAAEAWPDFVGWRVNYEDAAYAVAAAVDAPPALWSGPRRDPVEALPPNRPPAGDAAQRGKARSGRAARAARAGRSRRSARSG